MNRKTNKRKIMKKRMLFPLMLLCLTIISCEREDNSPSITIKGDASKITGSYVSASFLDVIKEADFIGEVKIVSKRSYWGFTGTLKNDAIWTDVEASIITVVKDSRAQSGSDVLTFSYLGGRVENKGMMTSQTVEVMEGDHLFVMVSLKSSGFPFVYGRSGVFRIIEGKVFTYNKMPVTNVSAMGIEYSLNRQNKENIEWVPLDNSLPVEKVDSENKLPINIEMLTKKYLELLKSEKKRDGYE